MGPVEKPSLWAVDGRNSSRNSGQMYDDMAVEVLQSSMISRRPRLLESQLCSVVCLLVQAVTFGIKTGHRCWTEAKDKVCAMGVRVGFCEWESHGVDYIN